MAAENEADRRLIARTGGYTRAAKGSMRDMAGLAVAANLRRYEDLVDPDRVLPVAERAQRAQSAMRARMTRLSLRAAQARRRRAAHARGLGLADDGDDGERVTVNPDDTTVIS